MNNIDADQTAAVKTGLRLCCSHMQLAGLLVTRLMYLSETGNFVCSQLNHLHLVTVSNGHVTIMHRFIILFGRPPWPSG